MPSLTPTGPPPFAIAQDDDSNENTTVRLSASERCGIVCDQLKQSSSLWNLYDSHYGPLVSGTSSSGGTITEGNISASTSTIAGTGGGSDPISHFREIRVTFFFVWISILGGGWLSAFIYWCTRMTTGYSCFFYVIRNKLCTKESYYPTSIWYCMRNVLVTASGGGLRLLTHPSPDCNASRLSTSSSKEDETYGVEAHLRLRCRAPSATLSTVSSGAPSDSVSR